MAINREQQKQFRDALVAIVNSIISPTGTGDLSSIDLTPFAEFFAESNIERTIGFVLGLVDEASYGSLRAEEDDPANFGVAGRGCRVFVRFVPVTTRNAGRYKGFAFGPRRGVVVRG